MKKENITLPNIITSFRLIGAFILLFLKPLSLAYFIIYSISGFTDAIDGFIARKLHEESEFGAKLDSICDLVFYSVLAIKILPILFEILPCIIWYPASLIVMLRILIYLYVAIKDKKLNSNHTYLNKATGLLIFLLPYILITPFAEPYCFMIAGVSLVAAIQEFSLVLLNRNVRY